jgi:cell wall-associated NlpC family hydrolase
MTESALRNVPYGDRDSLGLFQQRASWAPASTRLNPADATGLFLDALTRVPGWQSLPVDVAADQVQHSAYPWRVSQFERLAMALVVRASSAITGQAAGSACVGQGGDASAGVDMRTSAVILNDGVDVPAHGAQATVVAYAVAQLGKPYVWGATGPSAFDCSGLTQQAWAAAGVPLPRTTFAQVHAGVAVPNTQLLQPGDLLFTAGTDGTPASPGHVGLFIGAVHGEAALIQAPHTGSVVRITPLRDWAGDIVAIRRPAGA